ncbi:hypothetical protein [Alicyclobacillus fastidiosus]|uniref:Uncharacterized protein n=1 Tax=Alicyclobacillus fastidiosus TaxID=392011 RepID=A0ABV5ADA1_9BACL|nr:hypothetical protein [Alicyclobacillus fastidiosus]WEH08788.1 hypothetical protein PYS47_19165 [Alicyclobacillus fastidiosus]
MGKPRGLATSLERFRYNRNETNRASIGVGPWPPEQAMNWVSLVQEQGITVSMPIGQEIAFRGMSPGELYKSNLRWQPKHQKG